MKSDKDSTGTKPETLRKTFYIDRDTETDLDIYSSVAKVPFSQVLCSLIRLLSGKDVQTECDKKVRVEIRRVFEVEDFEKLVSEVFDTLSKKYRQDSDEKNVWIGGKIGIYATTRTEGKALSDTLGAVSVLRVDKGLKYVVVVSPSEAILDAQKRQDWKRAGIVFSTRGGLREALKEVEASCSHSRTKKDSVAVASETGLPEAVNE